MVARSDSSILRRCGALAALLGMGLSSSAALAAPLCRVDVVGPERRTWLPAAAELDAVLAAPEGSGDCASIVLAADASGARLTFTARDGRRAERVIEDPIELVPTVQALSAGAPAPAPVIADPEPPAPKAAPAKAASNEVSSDELAADQHPGSKYYELSPIFAVQLGVRRGADNLLSPTVTGVVALVVDHWELGLLGRVEAHYLRLGSDNKKNPDTSGTVLGVQVGQRRLAGTFALRAGIGAFLAALEEEGGEKEGRAEARVGAYAGGTWPERARTRLRLDVGAELVPYNIGRSEENRLGAPSLPWWAASVAGGVEFGGP